LEDVAFGRALRGGGNQQLLMFLLKTKGKARGYVEAAREREAINLSNLRIDVRWPLIDEDPQDEQEDDGFADEIVEVEVLPDEDMGRWG
jgi:hypothetical protein